MSISTTKSIRLAKKEAKELNQVARQMTISEAALMKKWVLEGIRAYKLEQAIRAYMERETDLRGGAAMANVSYNRFLHEVQKRNIIILDDDDFLDRLGNLAAVFDNKSLSRAVDQVASTSD